MEHAGYRPAVSSDPHYPDDAQAAEARVAAAQSGTDHSYGGSDVALSQSGRIGSGVSADDWKAMYTR